MRVAQDLRHLESFDADTFLASVQEHRNRSCGKRASKLPEVNANRIRAQSSCESSRRSAAHNPRHNESYGAEAPFAPVQEQGHPNCGKRASKLRQEICANRIRAQSSCESSRRSGAHNPCHRESFGGDALFASVQEPVSLDCAKEASKLRQELRASHKKCAARRQALDQPPTTLEELWEQICCAHGPSPFSIHVQAMLDIFRKCQNDGLGPQLNVALSPEPGQRPVNMEWRDFAYLFALALDKGATPIEAWSAQLSVKRCETDFCASELQDWLRVHREDTLGLVQFKRLIPAIADAMQFEQEYILSVLVWVEVARFEMPSKMYQLFFEKICKTRNQKTNTEASGTDIYDRLYHSSESKVETVGQFTRADFQRLCYSLGIVDHSGKRGRAWKFWSAWWDALIMNIPGHVEDYIDRRPPLKLSSPAQPRLKKEVSARMSDHSKRNLEGHTELTVFLELLFKKLPEGRFASPFDMCITFLSTPEHVVGERLKQRFQDRNGDGYGLVDYAELSAPLRCGTPKMADKEVTDLWHGGNKQCSKKKLRRIPTITSISTASSEHQSAPPSRRQSPASTLEKNAQSVKHQQRFHELDRWQWHVSP